MRISEADPTKDDLLKGCENEQRRWLPFFSRAQAGEDVPPSAPAQRPVPRLPCGPRHWGRPTEKNMSYLDVFRGWLSGKEKLEEGVIMEIPLRDAEGALGNKAWCRARYKSSWWTGKK